MRRTHHELTRSRRSPPG